VIASRQNSFLAVATLGVYLGLILAGATPSVLAQAATAKQFNVKDEVVTQEDLDSDPNVPAARKALETYLSETEAFIASLAELATSPGLLDGNHVFERAVDYGCGSRVYTYWSDPKYTGSPRLQPEFADLALRLSRDKELVSCRSIPAEGEGAGRRSVWTRIGLEQKYFWIELDAVRPSSGEASLFSDALGKIRNFQQSSVNTAIRTQLLKYLKFRPNDDQVRVELILPRGSLDTLLASNAK